MRCIFARPAPLGYASWWLSSTIWLMYEPCDAAESAGVESWLPRLSQLTLDELPLVSSAALRPAVDTLLHSVDRPFSTRGGSEGS